jgi:hypothetical protein
VFDDPNLVSAAGLVPVVALAEQAGLRSLTDEHLSVPTDKGANAGLKAASHLVGMVGGADSIDDLGLLRHGGMNWVFEWAYAPSTLGSFLSAFAFGHVRQLAAVALPVPERAVGSDPAGRRDRRPGVKNSVLRLRGQATAAGRLGVLRTPDSVGRDQGGARTCRSPSASTSA